MKRKELQETWEEVQELLSTFETGPIHNKSDTGFFHLPSGEPMSLDEVRSKFDQLAQLSVKAKTILIYGIEKPYRP